MQNLGYFTDFHKKSNHLTQWHNNCWASTKTKQNNHIFVQLEKYLQGTMPDNRTDIKMHILCFGSLVPKTKTKPFLWIFRMCRIPEKSLTQLVELHLIQPSLVSLVLFLLSFPSSNQLQKYCFLSFFLAQKILSHLTRIPYGDARYLKVVVCF